MAAVPVSVSGLAPFWPASGSPTGL
jgi:hypothetical protein